MAFSRWKSEDTYSYAFRLFHKYHEYMNSLYWAHVPASSGIQREYRRAVKKTPMPTTHQAFHLSGSNSFRVTDSLDAYSKHLKEFDNWTRLNTIVAVLSYFETYLSSVVSLAIESDLGILYSIPRKIDGVTILKYSNSNEYAFPENSEGVTKGTWDQRISCFKSLFNVAPSSLEDHISELERMRQLRNKVAHAFGRDIDLSRSRHTITMLPIDRLSENRLMRYMEIIINIAKDIDKQLLLEHIGEYELIHYYYSVSDELDGDNPAKELKTLINGLLAKTRSLKFCSQLLEYYESV